ncbi:MAG: AMP-binding protein [Roseicyclus sp.]|uniref:AMP-binding protein n=1 Tax=Boseongicola sp. H5 TaxID=2763261 RepID=UPI001B0BABE9|nr:AMP-binding protein [Boseongicola sp. H5]MBO6605057.1 AMP-binding protein [Roseicyclus sp.]
MDGDIRDAGLREEAANKAVLPMVIETRAAMQGDAVYLQDAEGSYTYAQSHAIGRRWARAFEAQGIGQEDRVLVMMPVSVEAVFAWLGLGWIGAVETPINYEYKGAMLDYIVKDSGARLLVVHAKYLDLIRTASDGLDALETIVMVGDDGTTDTSGLGGAKVIALDDFLQAGPEPEAPVRPRLSDLATIMYTSGTTGPSKGVMVSWRQVSECCTWTIPLDSLDETDSYYNPYPLFHIAGKLSIYTMALVGGRAVLRDRFSTTEFWSDVNDFGCTVAILLGAVANFLYRQPETPEDAQNAMKKVLMVPLIADVEKFKQRFDLKVCTCWNMTETSSPIVSPGFDLVDSASCGRPRPGMICRLVDDEDYEVPVGEPGELVIRSEEPWTLMSGYLGKPEKTVEAWRNQWLHTGDIFTRDAEGNFYYVDRKKDMIRRRGENVSSVEVEAEVVAFAGVLECAAYGVPSEFGEEEIMVALVCKPGHSVDTTALNAYLKDRLPRFMVPKYLRIIPEMPKTPTNKIRKTQLREHGVTSDTSVF